jgi:hypothetical protein
VAPEPSWCGLAGGSASRRVGEYFYGVSRRAVSHGPADGRQNLMPQPAIERPRPGLPAPRRQLVEPRLGQDRRIVRTSNGGWAVSTSFSSSSRTFFLRSWTIWSRSSSLRQKPHAVGRHDHFHSRHQRVLDLDHYRELLRDAPGTMAGSRLQAASVVAPKMTCTGICSEASVLPAFGTRRHEGSHPIPF